MLMTEERFIFVYQDVRGRFMSEGDYVNMRPLVPHDGSPGRVDESTDTYDTIDWLVKNVPNNNGKVGMWGISYPGFYASNGAIDAHPALVAVSPQAPIADWFFDDFHHHGAFFGALGVRFFSAFGKPRKGLVKEWPKGLDFGTPDGYRFFLEEVGPLKNVDREFFKGSIPFWNEITAHPNYDEFWQARNILPHLREVKPAVMVVGGWYDAEDLYGTFKTYEAIERQSPGARGNFVIGPWKHGGWSRTDGTTLGAVFFGDDPKPSDFYLREIELPFFVHHLKGGPDPDLPEAYAFETGRNRWRRFDSWPPEGVVRRKLFLRRDGGLRYEAPPVGGEGDSFVSDPARPVPFTRRITARMPAEYMTEDQRFAARRPDVLVYQTDRLAAPLTLAGPIPVELFVTTTGGDADWIVKLVDVYPDDHPGFAHNPEGVEMGGYQQLVRSEAFRGRFRNSYERPEPFVPGEVTAVRFELLDVLHTFEKGHRLMVQIQSTWFPLVDRNPQRYVPNIFEADEQDFVRATHTVHRSPAHASHLELGVLDLD
jgi:putative CocE/NonD family hydrolase